MQRMVLEGGKEAVQINAFPDHCPICHVGIHPNFVTSLHGRMKEDVEALFTCPKVTCKKMFIGSYRQNGMNGYYYLSAVSPNTFKSAIVAKEAAEISPQFAEIFSQASQAEGYGLEAVAGVGYRKSLEYLIKDYCVAQHPSKEDDIKKQPIGQVINHFVTNENVKQCAKRAVWIGNDETHYVKKWVDKDIKDLKLLIQITVNWIQQEVITKKLLKDMQ